MPDTQPSLASQPPPPAPTSLGNRLVNVFIAPSEAFDEVKNSPPDNSNWLVPLVLGIVVGITLIMLIFSRPGVIEQIRQPAEQQVEKAVKDGKMTRSMADNQLAMMEKFTSPTFLKTTGTLGTIFFQTALVFFLALVIWLIGTFAFRAEFEYMKSVEAVGLSGLILIPCSIATMLLGMIYSNVNFNLSPAILMNHFDPQNPVHVLISSFNIIWLWYVGILAVALARLSGKSFIKAAGWGYGLWAFLIAIRLGFVILIKVLFGGK